MSRTRYLKSALAGGAALALMASAAMAADVQAFDVPAGDLGQALDTYARQSGVQIIYRVAEVSGVRTPGARGQLSSDEALTQLLAGTNFKIRRDPSGAIAIAQEGGSGPQSSSAGGDVEALIVTAQKREENIQDVPIAISAFSQEALERSQIAGGPDLMTQIPNMTFTKTNFSSYSIQIRGIGTQAISATTDPAVAVAFNNTPFVRNRFFEQEFYDLERVEVLRGPQGTLYGRNATAGVVNIISAKPKFGYEAKLSADVGNYKATRVEGMLNFPLVEDMVALRLAGAWTKRDGYATNAFTGNPIDGRDLWSTRASLRIAPTDALDVNVIWEHFEEDDDRIRSGKQLCMKDPNKTSIAGVVLPPELEPGNNSSFVGTYNQGCLPASLYSPDSFQTPNGFALPYIHPLKQLGLPVTTGLDPYASQSQSRDLRVIESLVDPQYRAKSDILEIQASYDLSDTLTIQSETAYSTDELFSTQDYNRFITARGIFSQDQYNDYLTRLSLAKNVVNDGVFCDPQIGCSDRLVAVDLSEAKSTNFSQELRLSSDYEGPFNFSVGANYTRYDTEDKYYVFINSLSLWSAIRVSTFSGNNPYVYHPGVSDNRDCLVPSFGDPNTISGVTPCIYMDPNPIGSLNDEGHNYFLSKNPYRLISYAGFGEVYYNVTDDLKITGGLRYTVDQKHAPLVPSWLLASQSVGYPVKEILDLEWSEPTGRLAIDWKPHLSFTDETLLYASYAHGYKAGGANPPPMVVVMVGAQDNADLAGSVLHPQTFDAEFVDAFEIGTKNTLFDGRLTLNTNAFYYDYKGYQISQIIDRSAVNSNFDAEVWGMELEADWRPTDNLRLGFKGGYENTRLADGSQAIDLMDRTAGRPGWIVAKPFPALASNCILPVSLVTFGNRINVMTSSGGAFQSLGDVGFCVHAYIEGHDPVTKLDYVLDPQLVAAPTLADPDGTEALPAQWAGYHGFDPDTAPNNGEGFFKDLSGNQLPNAPHFTGTLTADYSVPLAGDWLLSLHADLYYQSEAWTRVFNTEGYDKLKAYSNINFAATFTNEEAGWKVMAYVKNVLDRDSITGAFLNSDDSGLTTNVFLTEPRLYGVRITKEFSDVPLLGGWFGQRRAEGPYPFTLELGGGPAHFDGEVQAYAPDWLALYSAGFPRPLTIDDEALDWGDMRDVKLTFAPSKDWRIAAAYRFGRTNGSDRRGGYEHVDGNIVKGFLTLYAASDPNHWIGSVRDEEQYDVVDFMVGREFGIGMLGEGGRSTFNAGLRYADFRSHSYVAMDGIPNRYVPAITGPKYTQTRHQTEYTTSLDSSRGFEGVGPSLNWEASIRLFGDEAAGHADLDWSIGGGVLFGQQTVTSQEDRRERYFSGDAAFNGLTATTDVTDPTLVRHRTDDVTVPNLSLSLGLSYSIDRVKVSTGYSYDRFFDVIDGGYKNAEQYDRTIAGPFLKLSVGFGG